MYFRKKQSGGRVYLQIVESRRDGDQVRQQVNATLGRFDELQASGQLERLVRSGARFAAKAMVLSAVSDDVAIKIAVRRIGPALVFERLWEETGCRAVIADAGWADAFIHGTGHGVGLEIHEAPRVASTSDDVLASGHVVTVEPGVYLAEHGGVRIEDTVVVTDDGCIVLTNAPKELVV